MRIISKSSLLVMMILLFPMATGVMMGLQQPQSAFAISQSVTLDDVPFVWQEINGFCNWAATSSALQYIGVELDLAAVFASSTVGFSYAYYKYNDSLLTYPGVIYKQVEPTQYLSELYGVNYTVYIGESLPGGDQAQQLWENQGINVGRISGQTDALELMRSTIDRGYPLLVSVDPIWLPTADYDYLRERGLGGGGHAILIVGYNNTEGTATIIDPGVGSFGDEFGYPDDGRGNYTTITYSQLSTAWSSRYYISELFLPGPESGQDIADSLGPAIRDKLLGVGSVYAPSSSSAFLWSFGEGAFREMSQDLRPTSILEFMSIFSGIEDEQAFKAAALVFMGIGIESSLTLQYLSFRTAATVLPNIILEIDETDFSIAVAEAIDSMSALSSNSTLIYPGNASRINGLVSTTFAAISSEFNSTGDLESAVESYSDDLSAISEYLEKTADAWLLAANELSSIWPSSPLGAMAPYIAIGGIAVVIAVIGIWYYILKKPTQ
jgi:hypothetical protein